MIIQNGKSRCFAYNSNRSEAGIAQPQPRVQRLLAGAGGQLEQKALHGALLAQVGSISAVEGALNQPAHAGVLARLHIHEARGDFLIQRGGVPAKAGVLHPNVHRVGLRRIAVQLPVEGALGQRVKALRRQPLQHTGIVPAQGGIRQGLPAAVPVDAAHKAAQIERLCLLGFHRQQLTLGALQDGRLIEVTLRQVFLAVAQGFDVLGQILAQLVHGGHLPRGQQHRAERQRRRQ